MKPLANVMVVSVLTALHRINTIVEFVLGVRQLYFKGFSWFEMRWYLGCAKIWKNYIF